MLWSAGQSALQCHSVKNRHRIGGRVRAPALQMTKCVIYPGVKRSRIPKECGSVYHIIFFLFPFCLAVSKNIAAGGRGCGDPLHQLALTLEVSGKGGR